MMSSLLGAGLQSAALATRDSPLGKCAAHSRQSDGPSSKRLGLISTHPVGQDSAKMGEGTHPPIRGCYYRVLVCMCIDINFTE